jgi:hypothetical protein
MSKNLDRADRHLTEQELMLALDGELSERGRTHLKDCRSCRDRAHSFENTMTELVRARNRSLGGQLHASALLRARLAEAAGSSARPPIWRLAPAAAVFLSVLAVVLAVFEARVRAEGPKPKATLTPGETRPITMAEVCRSEAEAITPNVTEETRRAVFAAYGIDPARRSEFEVDYLITPDLGGAESVRNMWPQPYSTRWNARVKDQLEQRLHQLVCEKKLDLATAQHDMALDWIGAWKKYVGANTSASDPTRLR